MRWTPPGERDRGDAVTARNPAQSTAGYPRFQPGTGSGMPAPRQGMRNLSCGPALPAAPICNAPGCCKPTWNRQPGEYCSLQCRDGFAMATRHAKEYADCARSARPTSFAGQGPRGHSHGAARGRASTQAPHCRSPGVNDLAHSTRGARSNLHHRDRSLTRAAPVHTGTSWTAGSMEIDGFGDCARTVGPAGCAGPKPNSKGELAVLQRPRRIFFDKGPVKDAGIVAFYFPGYPTAVDKTCQAAFLANFFPRSLQVGPVNQKPVQFGNAEAAFQSLKFWERHEEFQKLSGDEAFTKKLQLKGTEDFTYSGYSSNWAAMRHVLQNKFQDPQLRQGLRATDDAVLLEHNPVSNRQHLGSL
ncbi:unnamed protein product [Effrenium voratum]|nr:unnamed protein product [Effrenium voratum]